MNKIISKYYHVIIEAAKRVDYDNYEDLAHDVILRMYKRKLSVLKVLIDGKLEAWINVTTKNLFLESKRGVQHFVQIDDLNITTKEEVTAEEVLNDIINECELKYIERLWIEAFRERNASPEWVGYDLKIHRVTAYRRLEAIIQKIRCTL